MAGMQLLPVSSLDDYGSEPGTVDAGSGIYAHDGTPLYAGLLVGGELTPPAPDDVDARPPK